MHTPELYTKQEMIPYDFRSVDRLLRFRYISGQVSTVEYSVSTGAILVAYSIPSMFVLSHRGYASLSLIISHSSLLEHQMTRLQMPLLSQIERT